MEIPPRGNMHAASPQRREIREMKAQTKSRRALPGKGAHSSQDYSREENQLEVSGAGSTQCKIKQ